MNDVEKAVRLIRAKVDEEFKRTMQEDFLERRSKVLEDLRKIIASQIATAVGPIFDTNIEVVAVSPNDYKCEVRISSSNPAVMQLLRKMAAEKQEIDCTTTQTTPKKGTHKPMKFTKIDWEKHAGEPIVTFDSSTPKFTSVELPISCAKPEALVTEKGHVAAYLINYRPLIEDKDNVEKTRHCLYVTRETWIAIKKEYDAWLAQQPNAAQA